MPEFWSQSEVQISEPDVVFCSVYKIFRLSPKVQINYGQYELWTTSFGLNNSLSLWT